MAALYPLFFENLHDNIPSVREGAAIALANVVQAYRKLRNKFHNRLCIKNESIECHVYEAHVVRFVINPR